MGLWWFSAGFRLASGRLEVGLRGAACGVRVQGLADRQRGTRMRGVVREIPFSRWTRNPVPYKFTDPADG